MTRKQFCLICFFGGALVPAALLLFGGIVGISPWSNPGLDKSSAYLTALALLIFAVAYLVQRLSPRD